MTMESTPQGFKNGKKISKRNEVKSDDGHYKARIDVDYCFNTETWAVYLWLLRAHETQPFEWRKVEGVRVLSFDSPRGALEEATESIIEKMHDKAEEQAEVRRIEKRADSIGKAYDPSSLFEAVKRFNL